MLLHPVRTHITPSPPWDPGSAKIARTKTKLLILPHFCPHPASPALRNKRGSVCEGTEAKVRSCNKLPKKDHLSAK
jgi:hypothetical protein